MNRMKKRSPRFWAAITLFCTLLAACTALATGCSTNFYYDNAGKYTSGNADFDPSSVEALDIQWLNGDVEISFSGATGSSVSVTEDANKKLDESTSLHYWLDNTTLKIKFAASGKSNYSNLSKKLKVVLPSSLTLLHLSVSGVSASIDIDGARAERVTLNSVSGNVSAKDVRVYGDAVISTTSGNVSGSVITSCDEVKLSSTSGSIEFTTEARVRSLEVETTSGNISLSNLNPAKKCRVETVSGNTRLEFLDNAGFSVKFDSVSGDFETDFSMYLVDGKYVFGKSNSDFTVKTVSGDVRVVSSPT